MESRLQMRTSSSDSSRSAKLSGACAASESPTAARTASIALRTAASSAEARAASRSSAAASAWAATALVRSRADDVRASASAAGCSIFKTSLSRVRCHHDPDRAHAILMHPSCYYRALQC